MANVVPNSINTDVWSGKINWTSDTFKMMLLTSSASPSVSWAKRSDVTNEVAATGGYTAGGQTITSPTLTLVTNTLQISSASVQWTSATITARYAVIYKSRGGLASADEIVTIIDFGSDVTSTNGTFTVPPSASGWLTATHTP